MQIRIFLLSLLLTTAGVLRVRGQRLTLLAMTGEELRIGGRIDAVEWVR